METIVILTTAGVTILWSVRSFYLVGDRIGLAEESVFRIITIAAPSVYFLLLVAVGLKRDLAVRLDLIGMMIIDAVSLLFLLGSFLAGVLPKANRKWFGVLLYALYHLCAVACVVGVFAARSSPVLLLSVKSILRRLNEIDLFSFQWIGLDSQSQEEDIIALFNRVLIAVLSYLPIALLRFLTGIRHRRRIARELEQLRRRIDTLERASHSGEI